MKYAVFQSCQTLSSGSIPLAYYLRRLIPRNFQCLRFLRDHRYEKDDTGDKKSNFIKNLTSMEIKAFFSSFDALRSQPQTSIDVRNTDAKNELNKLLIWWFVSHFHKIRSVFIQLRLRSFPETTRPLFEHATRTTRPRQSVFISGRQLYSEESRWMSRSLLLRALK